MNLAQRKLNKDEWNSIEVSVKDEEKNVLKMITQGYNHLNLTYNNNLSLIRFLKIDYNVSNECYIYDVFFRDEIKKICKKYDLSFKEDFEKGKFTKINKITQVRIDSNFNDKIKDNNIYEYVLIDLLKKLLKNKNNNSHRWCYYYYTLKKLSKYDISLLNKYVMSFIKHIESLYTNDVDKITIVARSHDYIEKNEYILKYSPNKLFDHQKQIFSIYKNKEKDEATLIMYTAPTATGKTLTPLGLSEQYKIIFVCAARHVGVSLAKSAISIGKKVAFAFGCESVEDIRLHYFAAKEYEVNYKSGGIFKVDNTIGDRVEIMITDIKSYLIAMNYMNAFNSLSDIILFWDEPTITMDYEYHECHEFISKIWKENIVPNIILSSATLPSDDEIQEVFQDFINKNDNAVTISRIKSNECKKTIPIINSKGFVELPHYRFEKFDDLKRSIVYTAENKTMLRYYDLYEVVKFIIEIEENNYIDDIYKIDNYFDSIDDIKMETIKEYYLVVLNKINEKDWLNIYQRMQNKRVNIYNKNDSSGCNVATNDAYTLTDGPTIFIADDVDKIGKFCIKSSSIPSNVLNDIMKNISFNKTIHKQLEKNSKEIEDRIQSYLSSESDKKLSKLESFDDTTKGLIKKNQELNNLYKNITLDDLYIPNKLSHYKRWGKIVEDKIFTSDIDNSDVERVMSVDDIDDIWKLLLLMGIGLFSKDISIKYTEIVKLYLIIANGDYIYGTNYQFCHCFIGKDLTNMTQEKIIQSAGRVGRNKLQQNYTIRFRNDDIIEKLFIKEENKIEVKNMINLFKS